MSRRNANEYTRKQPEYYDTIYQEYYSEMDMSAREATLARPYLSRPRPKTKKNLAEKLKSLASKANETFQKTFNRDISKHSVGNRGSVSSLPEFQGHPSQHRRVMSVRPLPTIPPTPMRQNRHQRRPTGPREMPSELPCEEKNFKIEDLKQMQGSINIALEDLCNLVGVYSSLEDSRVEASIANKMNSIKETVAKLEVHVFDIIRKQVPMPIVAPEDDQMTAVHRNSRSSSADSIEQLKNLTQKLVHEVTKTRKSPRAA